MDVDVAERAQAVDAGTVEVDSPSLGAGKAREVGERPRQDDWRWIPDPAEVDDPKPPLEHGDSPSDVLIKTLAWVNLRYWG